MLFKYSLSELLSSYNKNKVSIHAHLRGDVVEAFNGNGNGNGNNGQVATTFLGMTAAVFMIALIIGLSIWIFALVILVKHWHVLPEWAQVIGAIGLVPFVPLGPIVTIIVVYLGKRQKS